MYGILKIKGSNPLHAPVVALGRDVTYIYRTSLIFPTSIRIDTGSNVHAKVLLRIS
jgi:hypothetical protein